MATTEDTSEQLPVNTPACTNHFPYVLAIQCSIGGRHDTPPTTEADLVIAQINTSVHASFIDSALVHHLGMQHKIRNRRPARFRAPGNPRPRILLPVYLPVDSSQLCSESACARIQVDFVVVSTHDMPIHEHQKLVSVEFGTQALFLHGVDILTSSRSLRVSGLTIQLPQIAPRDQKRLLSSIALAYGPSAQPSWERLRRKTEETNDTWESEQTLLRDKSTNSSISSTSYQPTTALTSPSLTEVDPTKETDVPISTDTNIPTPSPTTGPLSSALQFIPSSVVAKPSSTTTKQEDTPDWKPCKQTDMSRSQSRTSQTSRPEDPYPDRMEEPLTLPSIPSRKSSLVEYPAPPSPSMDTDLVNDDHHPRLPSALLDRAVQRKPSSTWPRSLGKKVAPWTNVETTKTSILTPQFESDGSVPPPPRKMKILKPARSGIRQTDWDDNSQGPSPGIGRDDDVGAGGKSGIGAKNLGGGAFHWMK